jgi:hypothetical protein
MSSRSTNKATPEPDGGEVRIVGPDKVLKAGSNYFSIHFSGCGKRSTDNTVEK